jgi:hypothetical protein
VIVYRIVNDVRLRFVWAGGPYIEVNRVGRPASEVINVWDIEKNKPLIEVTQKAFGRRVNDWVNYYAGHETLQENLDALEHDVPANWEV